MFALFHFGFEIFKIATLAAIYTTLILVLKFIYSRATKSSDSKKLKFRPVYLCIAGSLLIFSFTYYGNHGLGDDSYIPLEHWETMGQGDEYAYFDLPKHHQIGVDSFLVRNDHLCMASKNSFYDFQMKSGEVKQFENDELYNAYASTNHLPKVNEFKKFLPQYNDYWNGWRFWLLP